MTLSLVLVSCGGGTGTEHVELSGKPPAEAGAVAARAVCGRDSRCGHVSITCSASGPAGGPTTTTCAGRIDPVAFDDCFDDASSDVEEVLTCAQLSPAQLDAFELCFDMLASRACVTQAEVDAMARLREAGGEPAHEDLPAACAILLTPPPGCTGGPPTRSSP